jgi:hypothetical protein
MSVPLCFETQAQRFRFPPAAVSPTPQELWGKMGLTQNDLLKSPANSCEEPIFKAYHLSNEPSSSNQ